jgi:hypothetical protein
MTAVLKNNKRSGVEKIKPALEVMLWLWSV